MSSEHVYLTYNEWNGDLHKSTMIDDKGLSASEIQSAIDIYTCSFGGLLKEKKRLENLVDELLNENKYLRVYYDDYLDKSAGH